VDEDPYPRHEGKQANKKKAKGKRQIKRQTKIFLYFSKNVLEVGEMKMRGK
jgi:hypothetical protein